MKVIYHLRFILKCICLTTVAFYIEEMFMRNTYKFYLKAAISRDGEKYYVDRGNNSWRIKEHIQQYIGPGANSNIVFLPEDANYLKLRKSFLKTDVNVFVSDIIGIKRKLPDRRPDACREIIYPKDLPEISIVITFRDEPVSCLLRTIYSILETSPSYLIREIILVDDGSVNMDLKLAVQLHVANVDKLKLISNERPLGLMVARTKGIEATLSEYFIVLDGHIEVTPGWLEPVIYRLTQKPNSLLTSHVGEIGREIFELILDNHYKVFWTFDQVTLDVEWVKYSQSFLRKRNNNVAPLECDIIPGMMTAMRKDFFVKLGGFDTGMEIWGYEHIELSVKVWLCGGQVEMIPCSKIGHLYRTLPWINLYSNVDYMKRNKLRFILVWMDGEIQNLALQAFQRSTMNRTIDPGDLTDRYKIKTQNDCKPYQHYVDRLLRLSNVFVPKNVIKKGNLFNKHLNLCLDMANIDGMSELITYQCGHKVNQFCIQTENMNLRIGRYWIRSYRFRNKLAFPTQVEEPSVSEMKWKFEENGAIINIQSKHCLTGNYSEKVSLKNCNDSPFQKWSWLP